MRKHLRRTVHLPRDAAAVPHTDYLLDRLEAVTAAIPTETPLRKGEQLGLAVVYAWKDNPFRERFGTSGLDKAA